MKTSQLKHACCVMPGDCCVDDVMLTMHVVNNHMSGRYTCAPVLYCAYYVSHCCYIDVVLVTQPYRCHYHIVDTAFYPPQ